MPVRVTSAAFTSISFVAFTPPASAVMVALPAATPDTMGARQHPGAACHRQAAQVLTERLRSILSTGEQRFPL